jgi:hypothetical protein
MLLARRALREQFVILHRQLLTIVRDDEVYGSVRLLARTPRVLAVCSRAIHAAELY